MKADKASEPDAKAALLKLKQTEQVFTYIKDLIYVFLTFLYNYHQTLNPPKKSREHFNMVNDFIHTWFYFFAHFEQEAARKAKQQFKGLFDKRPGEIAEITTEKVKQMTDEENSVNTDREDDSSNAKAKDIQEAPKSRRGSYFNIRLISLLVLLVCFILVLTYSGELLGMSSPPDAMPVPDKYDDL